MILLSGLLLLVALIWLNLPPRDEARWAVGFGFGLTVAWLVYVGLARGLAAEFGPRGPLWLGALALLGAPLIQLLVWSAVTFATRPRAARLPDSDESEPSS